MDSQHAEVQQQADLVKNALLAVGTDDLEKMNTFFHPDASFIVPGGPYRIDGLQSYYESTRTFTETGGAILHVDIRQPVMITLGQAIILTFHFARQVVSDEVHSGGTGRGTAVISNNQIYHLHIEDNIATSLSAAGIRPDVLARRPQRPGPWGSIHPEPQ